MKSRQSEPDKNITLQKNNEADLSKSNKLFSKIFGSNPMGIIISKLETARFQNVQVSFPQKRND